MREQLHQSENTTPDQNIRLEIPLRRGEALLRKLFEKEALKMWEDRVFPRLFSEK